MNEQQYMDADQEVISMVNRGPGPGGELPSNIVHFIPQKRAPLVLAIDERIEQIQDHLPQIVTGMIVLSFLIGIAL